MNIHRCKDNARRAFIRVEHALSAEEIAVHWVNTLDSRIESADEALVKLAAQSEQDVLRQVRQSLSNYGEENPSYMVYDAGQDDIVTAATAVIEERFFS